MKLFTILELIQYTMGGIMNSSISSVINFKKQAILSNFNFIQTDFIKYSAKRKMDSNETYKKTERLFKCSILPILVLYLSVACGPLLAAINDLGVLPLHDHSHFPIFWPRVSINSYEMFV